MSNEQKDKLSVTKGEWKVDEEKTSIVKVHYIKIQQKVDGWLLLEPETDNIVEEGNDNATLIADAGNTYNACGLLPSELLKNRDELARVGLETSQDNLRLAKENQELRDSLKDIKETILPEFLKDHPGSYRAINKLNKLLQTKNGE